MVEVTGRRRFKYVDVPYTYVERQKLKRLRILKALEWAPPMTHTELQEVPSDHPDYPTALLDEAAIVCMKLCSLPVPHPAAPAQVFAPLQAARSTVGDGLPIS